MRTPSAAAIAITDRGIGIPADERPHIFDRFYRGSGAPLNRRGFGLGLAICRRIIEDHRGELRLTKTGSTGCIFEITLPIQQREK